MLDQHDRTRSLAAAHGENSRDSGDQDDETRSQPHITTSKRNRSASPVAGVSSKKHSPDESVFAWLANEKLDGTVLRSLLENLCKIMCLISKPRNSLSLDPNVSPSFPILNGTMSLQERQLTLILSSQACTPLLWTTKHLKILATLNFTSELLSLPNQLRLTGTGSLPGEPFTKPCISFSHTMKAKLTNITIILHHTLHQSILVPT